MSSYAQPTLSSNFTLSTDSSSASSALFEGKLRYLLEAKVSREDRGKTPNKPRVMLEDDNAERDRWKSVLEDHENLANTIHNLLRLTLAQ
ncbi:hypothetical protein BDM02DRAFT_3194535 [Thelephora ganbajun]|uniref:Uncharacterized protein n=1 Tax=Thelephora ganbajun TaxID=370292 RepID=A0ACB6YX78_THEGA|nr:hypothetical protein BDM02DRAFT_3194535 [Thelephora ganbajun]